MNLCHEAQVTGGVMTQRAETGNEYTAVKSRFKNGKLQILMKAENDTHNKNTFYIDMDETTHNRGLFKLLPRLRTTGKPVHWRV